MYLFDTNIISELFRRQPNPGVVQFGEQLRQVHISTISLDEVYFGLSAKPKPRVLKRFEILVATQCIVLPVTSKIAQRSGRIRGQLQTKGTIRSQADMLIAATAWQHNLRLVTRNIKDFTLCDIDVINPFI
ncbi:MAG: type II toxin-antitoxin system VapC family toxin [Cyanobacteria bacterium J06621_3]